MIEKKTIKNEDQNWKKELNKILKVKINKKNTKDKK
jgi:hypothetical protein